MLNSEASDHIFITYGCDFAFTQAEINYFFMDSVMNHWNKENPNINMFYSTPEKYIKEIKKQNEDFKSENIKKFENLTQSELNSTQTTTNQTDKAIS